MKKLLIITIHALLLLPVAAMSQGSAYQLSSHVLDISKGKPAAGVTVHLYRYNEVQHEWDYVYQTRSDADGRIDELLPTGSDNTGTYKLRFDTSAYFSSRGEKSIYPFIEVVFTIYDKSSYHIPVLISANGYSTYRGS